MFPRRCLPALSSSAGAQWISTISSFSRKKVRIWPSVFSIRIFRFILLLHFPPKGFQCDKFSSSVFADIRVHLKPVVSERYVTARKIQILAESLHDQIRFQVLCAPGCKLKKEIIPPDLPLIDHGADIYFFLTALCLLDDPDLRLGHEFNELLLPFLRQTSFLQ